MGHHTIRTRCPKQATKSGAAQSSCSSAPTRWPLSNSCNKSGSSTVNLIGAGNEPDPIVGLQEEGATFTIPKEPGATPRPQHRNIQCAFAGASNFFMPSLAALMACRRRKLRWSNISYRPAASNRVIGEIICILYANYENLVNPHPPR